MEEYAGGSTQNYETSRDKLLLARRYLASLSGRAGDEGKEMHELMRAHDTADRILLARGWSSTCLPDRKPAGPAIRRGLTSHPQ